MKGKAEWKKERFVQGLNGRKEGEKVDAGTEERGTRKAERIKMEKEAEVIEPLNY